MTPGALFRACSALERAASGTWTLITLDPGPPMTSETAPWVTTRPALKITTSSQTFSTSLS
jgi:hypothetical protein